MRYSRSLSMIQKVRGMWNPSAAVESLILNRMKSQWVYFVVSGKFVKIGYSSDLIARVKRYQTDNPEFTLVALIPGDRELEG